MAQLSKYFITTRSTIELATLCSDIAAIKVGRERDVFEKTPNTCLFICKQSNPATFRLSYRYDFSIQIWSPRFALLGVKFSKIRS